MRKLIPFVLSIPFTCFALGMVIGKANSPDYSSETSAHLYVREHAKPVKADAEDVVLEARAGTKVYTYSLKAGSLTHRIEMGKQSIERSWKTVGYKQISEILGLPSFASSLASVPGLLKEGRRWRHPETALVATVAAMDWQSDTMAIILPTATNPTSTMTPSREVLRIGAYGKASPRP